MKKRLTTYEELELISQVEPSTQDRKILLRKWCKTVWKFLVTSLTKELEPQVWQARSRNGGSYWRVYDPRTGQSASLGSEEETLAWIEQSYYHSHHSNDYSSGYWLR